MPKASSAVAGCCSGRGALANSGPQRCWQHARQLAGRPIWVQEVSQQRLQG